MWSDYINKARDTSRSWHLKNTRERERERDWTHSYWYIPSAPRVDYSLLVMASTGMMKMATGDDLPSLVGYWNASRLVFRRYRELWWRSGESRVISDGFYIYRIFGVAFMPRWATRRARYTRARLGPLACPGGLCPPRGSSPVVLRSNIAYLVQKKSPKSFGRFRELSFSAQKQHHGNSTENSVSPG